MPNIQLLTISGNLYFWAADRFRHTSQIFNLIDSIVISELPSRGVNPLRFLNLAICFVALACAVGILGCGTTTIRSGTEQLLISDAVDNAVDKLDFHELRGQKVFFDTNFLHSVKSDNFIDEDYVISAIRHQLTAAGALIQDSRKDADTIVEARVGALGTDGHEITYGIPKTGGLSAAASALSSTPVAALPEVSFAQTNAQAGIAKVIVYAYDQQTKEPIWQSGVAQAESNCSRTWVLGVGPFEKGTIYDNKRFAGREIGAESKGLIGSVARANPRATAESSNHQFSYRDAHSFPRSPAEDRSPTVKLASSEEDIAEDADQNESKSKKSSAKKRR